MKYRFDKNMRIMADLMTYCHQLGALDYHIDMKHAEGVSHCTIRCAVPSIDPERLAELDTELNRPRQKEIEQNFWGLSGENDIDAELTLVGMMVDKATITYENGQLTIHCIRLD